MRCILLIIMAALLLPAVSTAGTDYRYPFDDAYKATVYGTPPDMVYQIKDPAKPTVRSIKVKDRRVPDILSYSREMYYSTAMQDEAAPLIFIIAGTGAEHDSTKMEFLIKLFHSAGFHAVALSSPTHMNFVVSVSKHAVPGYVPFDVEDLYLVMNWIKEDIEKEHEVTGYSITGYSLGALHAAFLTQRDSKPKNFDFQKTLMINPPVSLVSSVKRLDSWLSEENLGDMSVHDEIQHFIDLFADYYERSDVTDFDDNFLYELVTHVKLEDKDLKALIGVDFRVSSSSMIFASDVCIQAGYLVPPDDYPLKTGTPLLPYAEEAFEISFEEYMDEYLVPYVQFVYPGTEKDAIVYECSLEKITDYLKGNKDIMVIGNTDDVILNDEDVAYLKSTFGDRARLFPTGGHCGNMMYPTFAEEMLRMVAHD